MRSHRLALGVVAAGHLLAAGVTAYAGVPLASPVVLALAGAVAVVLALAGPPHRAESRRPRAERRRLGRLQTTGRVADPGPRAGA